MTPAPSAKSDRWPPYQHAAAQLRREIKAGRYKPGDQLPPYRELQERFGVANMTARAALTVLRQEGLIYTIHGRGSFVADYDGKGVDYTPPAWYLGNRAEPEGEGADELTIGKVEPATEAARPTLTHMLTALRDEIRELSAEHQELRREVEALKKAQQKQPSRS